MGRGRGRGGGVDRSIVLAIPEYCETFLNINCKKNLWSDIPLYTSFCHFFSDLDIETLEQHNEKKNTLENCLCSSSIVKASICSTAFTCINLNILPFI
jgi:hypothetical protein